ncbi:Asp-tRNA(Asn)/Glu-tRNA(Gln) amidotransferase subunit GatC [Hydrogenivirga sp. 128-5-R1-1]|uniref:Asp-tRNA(Asn)/Glu-tRNA(Gln) amidotransferase subunit GatC n=1 Tax=Hydrogenivirga sp. 128-5-R1-1 TaxID=392423 RepID=UPI00015F379A|nr:Asp-tRNA(Asn)/Glu-tRNA(Gln) amidotransferase subunit GatC [Hydrogenivirga sp. 128-5-R1-1]EDP76374.1 glutamyl-tRNA (Gln) amidotransferase subunit C [Hydrogenivirga sp. 128-5-R1-1]
MVDRDWVKKIALLARLELTEEEVELFSRQLGDILGFVEQLGELDTTGVEPYIQNIEETPMREDKPGESLTQEEALKNAPERENGFFVVPRIVEV